MCGIVLCFNKCQQQIYVLVISVKGGGALVPGVAMLCDLVGWHSHALDSVDS